MRRGTDGRSDLVVVCPSRTHAGNSLQRLSAIITQLGDSLMQTPPLHLDDDRALLKIIRQPAITGEGNGAEYGELTEFKTVAQHTGNRSALAMPLVQ